MADTKHRRHGRDDRDDGRDDMDDMDDLDDMDGGSFNRELVEGTAPRSMLPDASSHHMGRQQQEREMPICRYMVGGNPRPCYSTRNDAGNPTGFLAHLQRAPLPPSI